MNLLNKKFTTATSLAITTIMVLTNISVVLAAYEKPKEFGGFITMSGILGFAENMLGWVYTFFFVIAAIFIIWAAFTYLTGQGNPEKVTESKNRMIYAVIAIVVALLAVTIRYLVENILQSQGGA